MAEVMYVGEGLVIEGSDLDNVAHIDLMIGPKDGPVGAAFADALSRQTAGHTNLLAVVSPPTLYLNAFGWDLTTGSTPPATLFYIDNPAYLTVELSGGSGPQGPSGPVFFSKYSPARHSASRSGVSPMPLSA